MPVRNGSSSICLGKSIRGIVIGYVPSILLSGLFSTRRKMNCSPTARPFAGSHAIKKEKWWDVSPLFTIGNMLSWRNSRREDAAFSRLSTIRSWPISFSMRPACGFPAGVWRRWTVRSISVPGTPGGGCWSAGTNSSPSMRMRTIRLIIKSCSRITDFRTISTSIPICVGWRWGS